MSLIGERLKALRGQRSLYEVGKDLKVEPTIISRFEKGQRKPNLEILRKIAEYYQTSFDELCFLLFEDEFSNPELREAVLKWAEQILRPN